MNVDRRMVDRKDPGGNRNRAEPSRNEETRNGQADTLSNYEEKGDVLSHKCPEGFWEI